MRGPSNTPGLSEKTGSVNVQIGVSRSETVSTQEGRGARVPKSFLKRCGHFRDQEPSSANPFLSVVLFLRIREGYLHIAGIQSCFWVPRIIGLDNVTSNCVLQPL